MRTDKFCLQLAAAVRRERVLWDHKSPDHRQPLMLSKAYERVTAEIISLYPYVKFQKEDIHQRFRSMKTTAIRSKRKLISEGVEPVLKYYDAMKFIWEEDE